MSAEDDPKAAAKRARNTPQAERMLRQFLSVDGPKGNTENYKEQYARIFGDKCLDCDGFGEVGGLQSGIKCTTCDGTGKKNP